MPHPFTLLPCLLLDQLTASPSRGSLAMSLDYLVGGAVSLLLAVFLVYALLRPERF